MFYVIEIATGDTKIAGKAVYGYEMENEAVASFHGKMSTAMRSDLYDTELLMVMDENGKVIKREKYVKPVVPEYIPDAAEE